MNNDRGENRGKGVVVGRGSFFSLSPSASLFLPAGEAPDVFAAWLLSEIAISQDSSVEVNSIRIFSSSNLHNIYFQAVWFGVCTSVCIFRVLIVCDLKVWPPALAFQRCNTNVTQDEPINRGVMLKPGPRCVDVFSIIRTKRIANHHLPAIVSAKWMLMFLARSKHPDGVSRNKSLHCNTT